MRPEWPIVWMWVLSVTFHSFKLHTRANIRLVFVTTDDTTLQLPECLMACPETSNRWMLIIKINTKRKIVFKFCFFFIYCISPWKCKWLVPGSRRLQKVFYQNLFMTFGDILLRRNDYTQTDRQTDRQTHSQHHTNSRASAGSAADKYSKSEIICVKLVQWDMAIMNLMKLTHSHPGGTA